MKFSNINNASVTDHEAMSLEHLIDNNFEKFSGIGYAKAWLLQTMTQFKHIGLRRLEQLQSIPFLLTDIA